MSIKTIAAAHLRRLPAFAWLTAPAVLLGVTSWTAVAQNTSDQDIRQALIEQSIAAYPGSCACPYSMTADGGQCGNNSAWTRGGGDAPLCFAEDVTDEMIEAFKKANGRS